MNDLRHSQNSEPAAAAAHDALIVGWDGPDDPENPYNWSTAKKYTTLAPISAITFIMPLSSSIFAPSIDVVMEEFGSTNNSLSALILSVYLIGNCFGPLVIAPLSELYGRSIMYHVCNVLFLAFVIGCALAPNLSSFIVFRLMSGLFGACPLTVGAGSIADVMLPEKRGSAMSFWFLGPLLGPAIAPIAGGYMTQALGWRWTFWLIAIIAGVTTIACFVFLRESYAYTILDRKTKRLRKATGNESLRSALDTNRDWNSHIRVALVRPTKMLLFSPIVFIMSLNMAISFAYLYLLYTAFPMVYTEKYQFSTGTIGLTYLGLGLGQVIGVILNHFISDPLAVAMKLRKGGDLKPEYRLPPMFLFSFFTPLGLFWFGWTAQTQQHWILPILGTGVFAIGININYMCQSVYLIDAFEAYAASASAAAAVFRFLLGAVLPLGGRGLFGTLGVGWGSSVLAFIAIAMLPVPFAFYIYGERIRGKKFFNVEF